MDSVGGRADVCYAETLEHVTSRYSTAQTAPSALEGDSMVCGGTWVHVECKFPVPTV